MGIEYLIYARIQIGIHSKIDLSDITVLLSSFAVITVYLRNRSL